MKSLKIPAIRYLILRTCLGVICLPVVYKHNWSFINTIHVYTTHVQDKVYDISWFIVRAKISILQCKLVSSCLNLLNLMH